MDPRNGRRKVRLGCGSQRAPTRRTDPPREVAQREHKADRAVKLATPAGKQLADMRLQDLLAAKTERPASSVTLDMWQQTRNGIRIVRPRHLFDVHPGEVWTGGELWLGS